MTNYEKITSMTDGELAAFLVELAPKSEFRLISREWCSHCQTDIIGGEENCPLDTTGCPYSKIEMIMHWLNLQSETKEGIKNA
ncbi:hypothetical protein LJC34_05040 [Oscillospiraceae bacterium OttesenSCG-928-G22]|nr:hypothetical protein [Oscillospiraceae bacterium OttesenSCG-928-G22]